MAEDMHAGCAFAQWTEYAGYVGFAGGLGDG